MLMLGYEGLINSENQFTSSLIFSLAQQILFLGKMDLFSTFE